MSKRVLIISASPRRGGNSDHLCDRFMAGAGEAGHDVEKIFLRDRKVGFCMACYYCKDHGGACAVKDDVPEIIDKMIAADVVVLSTPVYFYCMNAQLKAVIDRSVMKWTDIKEKDFYLIATAAEDDDHVMQGTVKAYEGLLECLTDVRDAGHIFGKGVYTKEEIVGNPAVEEAYRTGKNL